MGLIGDDDDKEAPRSVGCDHGTSLSPDYSAPFPFSGTLHSVRVDLERTRLSAGAPLPY
jgi:hypothetical protein